MDLNRNTHRSISILYTHREQIRVHGRKRRQNADGMKEERGKEQEALNGMGMVGRGYGVR